MFIGSYANSQKLWLAHFDPISAWSSSKEFVQVQEMYCIFYLMSKTVYLRLVHFDLSLSCGPYKSPRTTWAPETCIMDAAIEQAMLEVERDLELKTNSLVNGTFKCLEEDVTIQMLPLRVALDKECLAEIKLRHIKHSKRLVRLQKTHQKKKNNSCWRSCFHCWRPSQPEFNFFRKQRLF